MNAAINPFGVYEAAGAHSVPEIIKAAADELRTARIGLQSAEEKLLTAQSNYDYARRTAILSGAHNQPVIDDVDKSGTPCKRYPKNEEERTAILERELDKHIQNLNVAKRNLATVRAVYDNAATTLQAMRMITMATATQADLLNA